VLASFPAQGSSTNQALLFWGPGFHRIHAVLMDMAGIKKRRCFVKSYIVFGKVENPSTCMHNQLIAFLAAWGLPFP